MISWGSKVPDGDTPILSAVHVSPVRVGAAYGKSESNTGGGSDWRPD